MREQAQITCVFGARGFGKSSIARALLKDRRRVIAYDPQTDYAGAGWISTQTRVDVIRALRRSSGAFKISYTPDLRTCSPVTEAAWLADVAFTVQTFFPTDPEQMTLAIDEAQTAIPTELARAAKMQPMRAAILQGRHHGIGMVIVTQRPANIITDARANAAETYCFRLTGAADRRAVNDIAAGAGDSIKTLPAKHFLKIDAAGVAAGEIFFRGKSSIPGIKFRDAPKKNTRAR